MEQTILTSMHPRLGVTVVVQVVTSDGAVEACATNAACAALIDAGVPMRGVLCAAGCAVLAAGAAGGSSKGYDGEGSRSRSRSGTGTLVADPTADEEREAMATATMSFCFRGGRAGEAPPAALPEAEAEVVQTTSRGRDMSEDEFLGLSVLGRDAARAVYEIFRESAARFHARKDVEIEGMTDAARGAAARAKELGQGAGYRRSFGSGGGGGSVEPMEAAA